MCGLVFTLPASCGALKLKQQLFQICISLVASEDTLTTAEHDGLLRIPLTYWGIKTHY